MVASATTPLCGRSSPVYNRQRCLGRSAPASREDKDGGRGKSVVGSQRASVMASAESKQLPSLQRITQGIATVRMGDVEEFPFVLTTVLNGGHVNGSVRNDRNKGGRIISPRKRRELLCATNGTRQTTTAGVRNADAVTKRVALLRLTSGARR
ncbi:hypothetical protein VTK56DRAFT_3343 [Thermocarpiscus australiensis]